MPSSGPAKARALVIVDQLGFDAVPTNSARWPFVASPHRLTLGYIPRTTPVGHATISTGAVPSLHLIQGREWCHSAVPHPLNIDDLPRGRLDPRIAIPLGRRSLARRIRNSDPRARIVIAAAKAFIPFLFGADDADVSIYPTETKPQKDTQGRYRLVICVDPRSSPGNASLHRRALDVFAQTQRFVRFLAPGSGLEFRMRHRILELHWIVPSALASPSAWRDLVVDHGPDIDAYYGNVAQLFAADLGSQDDDAPTYLIHSWFSTDMRAACAEPKPRALPASRRSSDVDDGVPLFVAGPSPSDFPSRLDEVAAWFIGL